MNATPAQKLELARAAIEFAEASIDQVNGPTWSVRADGGGGDCGFPEHNIPHELASGTSLERLKTMIDEGKVKRAAFNAAWLRLRQRLEIAKVRYLAARKACGFQDVPR